MIMLQVPFANESDNYEDKKYLKRAWRVICADITRQYLRDLKYYKVLRAFINAKE